MRASLCWIAAVAFAAGCASSKKQTKSESDEPRPSALKPSSQIADAAQATPIDQATKDFQAAADEIATEMKGGKADWDDVASAMEDVARKHPGYGLAWYNLGVAYEKLGKVEEAETAYKKATKANPPVPEATINLASIAASRGDSGTAKSMLEDLVARDPSVAGAAVAVASSALARGDVAEAEKLAKQALSRDPRNIGAYCVLAHAAVKKKDFRRARLVAAQGFKIEADVACLHHALGLVALAENETAVAIVSFEKAAAKDPKLLEARFQIAQISMGFKDFKKAIANYAAVTEVDPKNPAAFVNLGVALKGSGNFAEAEKAYLKAVEVAGPAGMGEAHFNLGVLYLRNLGRRDDAKTQLKRYLQLADAGSDDPAFAMLEEIDKLRAMEEEAKRMEEEAKRQEEIERKAAEEEAKRKAEQEAEEAAERARQEEIDRKAKAEGEPTEPKPDETPAVPPPTTKPDEKRKAAPKKKKDEPADPAPPKPKDFE